uniref:Uncharacterized protein n=1 Tax=Streptomyces sp. NBC_01393 TaxID=2903851 RepID=A0AAU3I9Z9_9ACTN
MSEHVRLLLCKTCGSLEDLPDYEGDPSRDYLLEALVQKHPDHVAHPLMRVEKKHWDIKSTRDSIIAKIRENTGHTGLDPAFYNAKSAFQEDAHTCWQKHLRNPGCNDYKTASKRLTPDTAAERKAAGLPKYRSAQDRYLCEFCPVHSLVVQAAREKAGMYK